MPITYNGVGTRYVGHKNVESRPATCPHCRRSASLTSYDTRLWFVVLFIPIIPLVRKRIIDQCSACRRHYVMPLDEWEANKQLSISGAMGEFRDDPTPEKAVAAHRQLIGFHQSAQAEEFGQTMAERFPDSTNVLLYLGHASDHVGRGARAGEYFRRALELRPDLPEARLAVAESLIDQGKADEARPLLDFLEKPGAARVYSAAPLERLGNVYQAAGRHAEALNLYGQVLREIPTAAQHAGFRKKVQKSEKALGHAESILPKRQFSWRTLFSAEPGGKRGLLILAVALVLACIGAVGVNFWTSRQRTLHLVNAYAEAATVQIDGQVPVQVPPGGRVPLTLAEGRHHAVVSGPTKAEETFDLGTDYLGRWFGHPAWVYNVGGNALLLLQKVHYSNGQVPAEVSFHTGQSFEFFPGVDHAFEKLPDSVRLEKGEHDRVLSSLETLRVDTLAVVQDLLAEKRTQQALDLCESRLRTFPAEQGLLGTYLRAAEGLGQVARALDPLRAGLTRRPVETAWHRAYQTASRLGTTNLNPLRAEYDKMLAAEPESSALLYLRGRICEQPKEAQGYFGRAIAADPKNAWPRFGSAYDHALEGDWKAARPLLEQAVQLSPDTLEMDSLFFDTRLALGETDALVEEQRRRLKVAKFDATALCRLADALSAAGRGDESCREMEEWCANLRTARTDDSTTAAINQVRHYVLYSVGDFQKLDMSTLVDHSPNGERARLQALIEQGELKNAASLLEDVKLGEDRPIYLLALSIAASAKGDSATADDYRQRAQQAFTRNGWSGASAAALLAKTPVPGPAEFATFDLDLETKRLVLTACALRSPGTAADGARLAATLNVSRTFPYHLLRRVTQGGGKAK